MIICKETGLLYDEKILFKDIIKNTLNPGRVRRASCDSITVLTGDNKFRVVSPVHCIRLEDYENIMFDFSNVKHINFVFLIEDSYKLTLISNMLTKYYPQISYWYEFGHKLEYDPAITLIIKDDYFKVHPDYNVISIPSGPSIWLIEIFNKTIFI